MLGNTEKEYGGVARGLHWVVAALIIVLFGVGIWMHELPRGEFKGAVYGMHKAFGMLVVLLVAARLAWRLGNVQPRQPDGPAWQHFAAHAAHWALYALMIAVPVMGWLMSDSGGHPTSFFGLFTFPTVIGKDEGLHEALEEVHEVLAFALIGLVVAHAAAAVWHHVVRRDDVLTRMLPPVLRP